MRFIGVLDEKGEFIQLNTQAIKTFYTTVDVERALEIPTDPFADPISPDPMAVDVVNIVAVDGSKYTYQGKLRWFFEKLELDYNDLDSTLWE